MHSKPYLPWLILLIPLSIMLTGQIFAKQSGNYIATGGSILVPDRVRDARRLISRGFLWIFIVRRMRLVFAYPVMSINYILVLFVSWFIFDEKIISTNLIGAGLISLGVVLIGFGEKYNGKDAYPNSKRSARPGKDAYPSSKRSARPGKDAYPSSKRSARPGKRV